MLAAGYTLSVEPTASSRSQPLAPRRTQRRSPRGSSAWPNEIVSLLRMPPHTTHGGSSSPARTRSSVSSIGRRSPHSQQRVQRIVPCTSITLAGSLPACWCSPSMFWVTTATSLPWRSSSTSAAVPGVRLGRPGRRAQPVLPRGAAHLRIGEVVLDRRRLLGRRVLRPHPVRPAEVGDARVGRDAGAGEHRHPGGVVHPAARIVEHHLSLTDRP